MRKWLWKTEGGDIYIEINYEETVAVIQNPRKMLFGRNIHELKDNIHRYLRKQFGFRDNDVRYTTTVDVFPKPFVDVTLESYTRLSTNARFIKKRCAYLMRQPSGRFDGIHFCESLRFTGDGKSCFIDLKHGIIDILPGQNELTAEWKQETKKIAKRFPDGIFSYLPYFTNGSKLIGIKDGLETVCELHISSDLKHYKLKEGLKIIKPGYFNYFQSNSISPRTTEYQPLLEKFLAQSQLHLDIS